MANNESENQANSGAGVPPSAAVSFVTTEHFTLQGARSSTMPRPLAGRACSSAPCREVLSASGSLPPPRASARAFVGLVTFNRALQSGIEDFNYAHRIARLRGYYFQYAPELVDYLLSVPSGQRMTIQGLRGGPWQKFVTVAGMVSVVTAVLAGSAAGLFAAVVSGKLLIAALLAGLLVAVTVLVGLIRFQTAAWQRVRKAPLFPDEQVS